MPQIAFDVLIRGNCRFQAKAKPPVFLRFQQRNGGHELPGREATPRQPRCGFAKFGDYLAARLNWMEGASHHKHHKAIA
jgi:hypothetical protein